MDLTIDLGNSFAKLCVFDGNSFIFSEVIRELSTDVLSSVVDRYDIKRCAVASVVDNKTDFDTFFQRRGIALLEVTNATPLPIINGYATPKTLGIDRIAGVVGAYSQKRGEASLVVDIGTCVTYDFIDETGTFIGGNIAPGYKMRLDAMHAFTDKLPEIQANELPKENIGVSTAEAMKAGAFYGILYEIEGIIATISLNHPNLNVFLTGGGHKYFANRIKSRNFAEPNLIHIGLLEILRFNLDK